MNEIHPAADRWTILPGDPPELRQWLTSRQAEKAAQEPLPPPPPPPEESPL